MKTPQPAETRYEDWFNSCKIDDDLNEILDDLAIIIGRQIAIDEALKLAVSYKGKLN